MKRIICLILALLMLIPLAGCDKKDTSTDTEETTDSTAAPSTANAVTVAMEIKDYGKITLELYPEVAPITVENFLDYVKEGFYDGLTFHRIISGFMIQGGDPTGTGYGDASLENIKGEFTSNGFENNLKHERGVISMARSRAADSASSQFFICHQAAPHLDGDYAAFGKMTDGFDVLDAVASVKTDANYKPTTPVVIEKMYIVE